MSNRKKHILIVDDNDDIRTALSLIVEEEGYLVDQASDGQAALSKVKENHYDLLVTDIFMPKMNGVELCTVAKSYKPDLKFILISGGGRQLDFDNERDELSVGYLKNNSYTVLKKPFSPEHLVQLISEILT